jgi:hypothetical protein
MFVNTKYRARTNCSSITNVSSSQVIMILKSALPFYKTSH